MKIIDVEQRSDEWRAFREEKISGTKIGKLFAKSRKTGELFDTEKPNIQFYQIMAERLATGAQDGIDEQSAMERGIELENEAIQAAVAYLELGGKYKSDGVWQDDKNPNFICSPDAYEDIKKPTWAIETKCLSSANHLKAIYEGEMPNEYIWQVINYFLVNPALETLYFVMYDPRFYAKELQLEVFTIKRSDVADKIAQLRNIRDVAESKISDFVEKVSF